MTLETEIGRLATAFERIALAMEEAIDDTKPRAAKYTHSASEVTGSNTGSGTAGSGIVGATSQSDDEKSSMEPPKKRGRPTKEETAAKAADAKPTVQPTKEPESPKSEVTINDVRAAMTALQSRKDAVTAKDVLEQFGVKALSMLPVESYAKVIAAAKAA